MRINSRAKICVRTVCSRQRQWPAHKCYIANLSFTARQNCHRPQSARAVTTCQWERTSTSTSLTCLVNRGVNRAWRRGCAAQNAMTLLEELFPGCALLERALADEDQERTSRNSTSVDIEL